MQSSPSYNTAFVRTIFVLENIKTGSTTKLKADTYVVQKEQDKKKHNNQFVESR